MATASNAQAATIRTARLLIRIIISPSLHPLLIPHLENLCIDQGATEVTGTAPDFARLPNRAGHSVEAKLAVAMELEPAANLVFIHRDADGRDPKSLLRAALAAASELSGRRQE